MSARRCCLWVLGLLVFCATSWNDAFGEKTTANRILATYRVDLAGFKLGEFHVTATLKNFAYKMQATGRFSILAGIVYRATGRTTSTGKLTDAGPEPSGFTLKYQGGKKREQRHIEFTKGTVSEISISPKKRQKSRIPLTKEQLEDVLDPLTAAFSHALTGGQDICQRTLPVFDGTQRFDIVLTPKRGDTADKKAPICQVKFVPIAGHRPDHPGVKFMAQSEEIEVSLIPLPQTHFYVPRKISVPTALGPGDGCPH